MSANPADSPMQPTISTDLPCADCGYNVRTLPADGRCPECNWPIAVTRRAPVDTGTPLLIAAFLTGVIPWLICRPLLAIIHIREGAGTAAILFATSAVACLALIVRGRYLFRRWGRHRFGRTGPIAIVLSSFFALATSGMGGFAAYAARDTTVYAAGFNEQAFVSIQPGMTRAQVEKLIGPPLELWTAPTDHEQVAEYSKRAGFLGWTHRVCYTANDVVKTTFRMRTAD